MAYSGYSSTKSYKSGKFRARVKYSFSDNAISWQWEVDVTKKFSKKLYFFVRWKKADGNWSDWKRTSSKRNSDLVASSTAIRSLGKQSLEVKVGVGTGSSPSAQVTIPTVTRSVAANAPSKIEVNKLNDAHYVITVSGTGFVTRPTNILVLERATGTKENWTEITRKTIDDSDDYTEELHDQTTSVGEKYWYRVKAVNNIGGDSGYITSDAQYTSPKTDQNINVSVSGNEATLNWSVDSVSDIDKGIIKGWYIEQATNDGSYQRIGQVEASASQYDYSYTTIVAAGSSYKFRLVSYGLGGESYSSGGSSASNTPPSMPYSLSAYRNTNDNVILTIEDTLTNTAESVVIERSIDGGLWYVLSTETFPCKIYIDETAVATDTIRYRIKNVNSEGESGYVESETVSVKSKPNAPSLISPINDAVIDLEQYTIKLTWRHNSTDGSPQRQAELQYKIGSGTWQTVSKTTETYYSLSLSGRSANEIITWRVRTKGSHADWSNYSEEYSFKLLQKPEIHITSPNNADVIDTLPLILEYSYDDNSGTLQELEIDIIKDAEIVKTYVDENRVGTFSLAGFLFDNEENYGIRVRALSSSGLRADDIISISIQYALTEVEGGLLLSLYDDENGYVYISAMRDITDNVEPVDIVEAYLYRLHDGEREFLGVIEEDNQIIDKLAPINADYNYEFMQLLNSGELVLTRYENVIETNYSFIYFGEEIFKAIWNQEFGISMDRPERVERRYDGRRYGVSFDSKAVEETCNFTTDLDDREELVRLKMLMRKGNGQGIWKSADGDSYHANFKMTYNTDMIDEEQIWRVNLSVTRIEGDALG